MRPGETDPNKKRIYFPLFDADGLPASGEVDEGAIWVPVAGEVQVNRDEAGYGDVVDLAAFSHRGNGFYRYEYDDTEIAGTTEGVILLRCKDLAAIRTQVVATPLETPATATISAGAITAASIAAGAITPASFSDDAQKLLFGIIFNGFVSAFSAAQATLVDETPAQDNVYRGCLFHVWAMAGESQTWVIAGNVGNILTLVGGDEWPVNLTLSDGDGPSKVAIVRFGDSLGTLFDRGGPEFTNGRQQLCGVSDVMLGTDGENVGQPVAATPATFKDETGANTAVIDVDATTGAKTVTWSKSSP